jgi:predicted ATPase
VLGINFQTNMPTDREEKTIATEDSSTSLPLPQPPPELVKACIAGDYVVYIGAGMAAQAGLPIWKPFVTELLDYVLKKDLIAPEFGRSLEAALAQGQTNAVADGIVSSMSDRREILHQFLKERFALEHDARPRVYDLVKELNPAAVLTTNFDRLLEYTYADKQVPIYTHRDSEALLEALSQKRFFLLELYGNVNNPDTVLLAPAQYIEAMHRNAPFSQFMDSLFFSRTILFLGASLEGIQAYLSGIQFRSELPQKHFALVNVAGTAWRVTADLLFRRYGIQVLPYTASENFTELRRFLERLRRTVRARRRRNGAIPQEKTARLKSVRLVNIGPFEQLELELSDRWNVLLGDNGVGKSTILKAIAVAICGEAAEAYAHRLVRSGCSDASIRLRTNQDKEYVTQIFMSSGRAKVTSVPSTPLEAEGWLALGFPALRTITWERTKELPPEGEGRSTPEDSLPLIRGDSDPRLDKLKAWIVNLDYIIKDLEARRGAPGTISAKAGYEALLHRFFDIVARVTPGIMVKFGGVDPQTKEVTIHTEDGLVPIETVSQGTASLLGWLGILLQRMHEMYSERNGNDVEASSGSDAETLPQNRYALVLIDELDAHMHPKWQRLIVGTLKELFPNAQFVATTHSPLIVVGLERSEIYTLHRQSTGPDRSTVILDRPKFNPKGWYSDQVLTSPLFGLESTLAPELATAVDRYTELAARDEKLLTQQDESEMARLAEMLDFRMPAPHERRRAREAFDLLETAIDDRLKRVPVAKQKELLEEAKVQLQEFITRSRRPG